MSSDDADQPATTRIKENLAVAHAAEQCLELAAAAESAGDAALQRACLERAIALDRHCQAALLNLAALSLDEGDAVSAFCLIEETSRVSLLPAQVEELREQLYTSVRTVPEAEYYLRAVGRTPVTPAVKPLSVLVVTSIFSSNDVAESTRAVVELVGALLERGHNVRVLTADSVGDGVAVGAEDEKLQFRVLRTLRLGGARVGGKVIPRDDVDEGRQRTRDNAARVRTAVTKSAADLVLAANFELLDIAILRPALERNVPVLHWLAGARPPFSPDDQPLEAHYSIAPVSDWTGTALRNAGYQTTRMETLYPGVRVDRCFRLFLPDTMRLRICFAAPLRPTSGAETLVRALAELHRQGVDFSAELAGEAPDSEFLGRLQAQVREQGFEEKVSFVPAPTDVAGLAGLFARSNVFVSATQTPDPFALSQVEAMAAGLVIVSSGTGGSKEIVREDVDGLLFRAGDVKELAGKLLSLSQQPELYGRLQRAGQARANAFSAHQTVARIEALATEMKAAIEAACLDVLPSERQD